MIATLNPVTGVVTNAVPFVPTPVNKDDDTRTSQIAAEASTKLVRSAPADPPPVAQAAADDQRYGEPFASGEHEGRAMVADAVRNRPSVV